MLRYTYIVCLVGMWTSDFPGQIWPTHNGVYTCVCVCVRARVGYKVYEPL